MSGSLVRLRIPATSSSNNLRPGLAAIRTICAAPISSPQKSAGSVSHGSGSTSSRVSASVGPAWSPAAPLSPAPGASGNPVSVSSIAPAAGLHSASDASAKTSTTTTSDGSDSAANTHTNGAAATVSKWLRRSTYVVAGAAVAGGTATYAADPQGTRETLQSFRQDVNDRIRYFTEPSREKLLPDAIVPYPGAPPLRTLVIDLDNTLVHSSFSRQFGWRVAKRPGAEAFLAYLSSLYEIVIFTDGLSSYADPILNKLDPNRYYISYRLYRAETKYEGGAHVKDLSHLNRDLSRVILVDHDPKHFKYHPQNAIRVPKWNDDPADSALLDLIPFLEDIVHEDCADVREEISRLEGKPLKTALAEHRSLTSLRSERSTSIGRGGLFGTAPSKSTSRTSPSRAPSPGTSVSVDEKSEPKIATTKTLDDNPGDTAVPSQTRKKSRTSIFRPAS